MRLDKFLKLSRIIKRRSVASDACGGAHVSVNGKIAKPAHALKIGDVISVRFGERVFTCRVKAMPEHVTKDEASSLYEVLDEA